MYAPRLGRFVSRDPAVFIDGYSHYRAAFVPDDVGDDLMTQNDDLGCERGAGAE